MASIKLYNLARMTTGTTGTGTMTLDAAVASYLTFAQAGVQNGDVVRYAIEDGAGREIGFGTYTSSGTTLSRDTVNNSTNGGNKLNLSGSAQVFITPAGADFPWNLDSSGVEVVCSVAAHINRSPVGITANANADDFIIEVNGAPGMSFLGGPTNTIRTMYGNASSNNLASIEWQPSVAQFAYIIAGSTVVALTTTRTRLLPAMAIPSGGTTGSGITVSSATNFGIFFGSGAPTLSAAGGSWYMRTDGTTSTTRMYINSDSGTTWTAVVTVG